MAFRTLLLFTIAYIAALTGVESAINAPTHGRRVVCFLASWGIKLNAQGRFNIYDAKPGLHLCTHLVYNFANLDGTSFKVKYLDERRDIAQGGIVQTIETKLENPHLRVMIGCGGWTDEPINYSRMTEKAEHRKIYVESAVAFILKHKFDGMDLNWQFPGDRGGTDKDKSNVVLLVKELREAFDKHGLILSVSVSCMPWRIELGYDGKGLSDHAHFLNILSYEYHGWWDSRVGPSTPLFANDGLSINNTVNRYLAMGVPPEKLNLGLSSYGMTFLLVDPVTEAKDIIGKTARNFAFKGPYADVDGFMAENELCIWSEDGTWQTGWDEPSQTPYSISGVRVVTHDNDRSREIKIKYAMEHKLGGVLYYGLEKDDFAGACKASKGKYPALRSIDKFLLQYAPLVYGDLIDLVKRHSAQFFWNGMKE